MIARLRARHRAMWIVLLFVAPVVIAEAGSVRRGEAARQELSPMLASEFPPMYSESIDRHGLGGHTTVFANPGDLRNLPGGPFGVVEIDSSMGPALEGDVLVYWSVKAAASDAKTSDASLPEDAILLGAWPASGVARLEVPEALTKQSEGALLWYSLTHASVVKTRLVADMTWTIR